VPVPGRQRRGVTAALLADEGPFPAALRAVTVRVCERPAASPDTVAVRALGATVTVFTSVPER
jgi:hypothetical protein